MNKRIAVIPGDGIGTEVTVEAVKVLEHVAGDHLCFETLPYGAEHYLKTRETLPASMVDRIRSEFAAVLVGALGDPRVPDNVHARDILLGLRFKLDLFVNLRPVELYSEAHCPLRHSPAIDIVCFRENTEGLYVGVGGRVRPDTEHEIAINEDINTYRGVERIIRAAFDYAVAQGRRKLCMSDKSNAMRFAHGLWRRVFDEVRPDYPNVEASHLYVDVLAMQLVRQPEAFDVIVTCNLFGDIISDLGAGLVGGLGLAASANVHPGQVSLFEPVHGSAPDIAGQHIANPLAAILSAGMLLDHIGLPAQATTIRDAVRAAVDRNHVTPDLGGTLSTPEVGDAVCRLTEKQ